MSFGGIAKGESVRKIVTHCSKGCYRDRFKLQCVAMQGMIISDEELRSQKERGHPEVDSTDVFLELGIGREIGVCANFKVGGACGSERIEY